MIKRSLNKPHADVSSKTVRFGLIGVGRWGAVYLKTLLALGERCRIAALATSRPDNAARLPYPVTVHADWRPLVSSDCDAVIIATPPHTHPDILEACLKAGKPCIVEKPFCLDGPTAERLHRAVQSSRVPVLVNHTHLFDGAYLALKDALAASGEPIRVVLSEGMSLGPFRADVSALWDWAPHDASLCLDLLGGSPQRVVPLAGPGDPRGAPEQLSIRLDFPAGVSAWITVGRLSPVKRRSLSVLTDRHLYVWDAHATHPLTASPIDFARRYDGSTPEPSALERRPIPHASDRTPMERMLTTFMDGLSGGDRSRFGTALALDVVRVLADCETSLEQRG